MSDVSFNPASSSSSAAPNVPVAPADVLVDVPADASVSAPVDTQIPASVATAAIAPNLNSSAPCRCEVCGVGGIVSNFYSPRFCSRECRYERNKGNHVLPRPDIGIITCRECSKVGSSTEFFSAKYCSKKCRYERGGRPAPHSQSNDAGVTGDSSSNLDPRHKAKRDLAALSHSAALPSDSIAFAARAVTLPVAASAARGVHVSTYHHLLHNSAAANTIDSTSNHVAATVAANWQLLVDYQPRDREQAASVPYLLDAIAALQESIVHSSLECARAETLLEATNRRLQELDNDINTCTIGASDAASVEDRKLYHDIIRKMWVERALLQKDEIRMLEQLRKQLESKSKLRTQLLDKQQTLLTLGLTLSRRACRCPVAGCNHFQIDSVQALRSHLDRAHGVMMQDIVDSQGWNSFISDILRKPLTTTQYFAPTHIRSVSKPAIKGASYAAAPAPSHASYAVHVSDLVSRIRTETLAALSS